MPEGRRGVRNTGNCEGRSRGCSGIGRFGGSSEVPDSSLLYGEWVDYWKAFVSNWKVWLTALMAFVIYRLVRWSDGSR